MLPLQALTSHLGTMSIELDKVGIASQSCFRAALSLAQEAAAGVSRHRITPHDRYLIFVDMWAHWQRKVLVHQSFEGIASTVSWCNRSADDMDAWVKAL